MNLAIAFLRPELWPLLLVGPAVALLLGVLARRRDRRLTRALGARHAALSTERRPRGPRRALLAVALVLVALAAVGPAGRPSTAGVDWRGADLLVVLDVSRSMLARDLPPDRLTRAKQEIRALTEQAVGDRFGLVVFAGDAALRVPLTRDAASFLALVDEASPDDMRVGGTDVGAAIDRAREALARRRGAGAVVLITDGEDLSKGGLDAARRCHDEKIVVHAVGLGTPEGGTIRLEAGGVSLTLRDPGGREVVSRLDEEALRAITAATGGGTVTASARQHALVELYEDEILPTARRVLATAEDGRREDLYRIPLLAALALLLLELSWPLGRHGAVLALLVLLGGCDRTREGRDHFTAGRAEEAAASFGRAAEAAGKDASTELLYDLALASLHAGALDEAAAAARRVSDRPEGRLAPEAAFVRGCVAFERSRLRTEEARKTPDDLRAMLPAIRDAEDALAAWQWAAASRPDWPAARRNAARARLWLEGLREQRGDRREEKKKEPPPPPPDVDPTNAPEPPKRRPVADLPPKKVLGLFDLLREKEEEKRGVRKAKRVTRRAEGSRDW